MAQHSDYNIGNQGFPAFRTDLNNVLSAINTLNSGTSRPASAVAGSLWLDTTTSTAPTLKYYDGADDISLATIDHTTNTVNWLDSTVSVTGLTTTATGTVLTLSDSANTSTVNLIIDNDKEIRFREATANGTNYISLSAPASLSADVTYTLPVAPTANNQALISSTAGAMSFTPYSLPASDGTANQILKTNGSGVLSFATPSGGGFSGATTTSSAVDITLTSLSTQVQSVEMTAADKAVILPDATTMTTKGFPAFVIINTGVYAILLKDNGGSVLATINPATSTELTLVDNSTLAGIWAKEDAAINFKFSPYTTIKTGTSGSPNLSSIGARIYSGITASAISSTSAIIGYHAGTSNRDVYGVVVSYSGTTITVNSETLLYSGTSTASVNSHVLMLDATTGFLFVNRASNNVVVPFTISGTTITAGTASSTFGTGSPATNFSNSLGTPIAMSSTIALVPDRNSTTLATWTLRTITHNGASAPTIGTASSSVTTRDIREPVLVSKIDSTNAFMAYAVDSTSYPVARVVTISGSSAPTLQTANSYTGVQLHSVVNPSESGVRVHSYTVVELKFGDNFLTHGRDSSTFIIRTKLGSYLHVKQKGISFARSFSTNNTTSTYGSAWAVLDSTTGIGVTNNNGGTTISATIIKYIGA
jgi:hypothetical protein